MDDLYQNQRIFSSNINDIGGWGYIENIALKTDRSIPIDTTFNG